MTRNARFAQSLRAVRAGSLICCRGGGIGLTAAELQLAAAVEIHVLVRAGEPGRGRPHVRSTRPCIGPRTGARADIDLD